MHALRCFTLLRPLCYVHECSSVPLILTPQIASRNIPNDKKRKVDAVIGLRNNEDGIWKRVG